MYSLAVIDMAYPLLKFYNQSLSGKCILLGQSVQFEILDRPWGDELGSQREDGVLNQTLPSVSRDLYALWRQRFMIERYSTSVNKILDYCLFIPISQTVNLFKRTLMLLKFYVVTKLSTILRCQKSCIVSRFVTYRYLFLKQTFQRCI